MIESRVFQACPASRPCLRGMNEGNDFRDEAPMISEMAKKRNIYSVIQPIPGVRKMSTPITELLRHNHTAMISTPEHAIVIGDMKRESPLLG